MQRDGEPRGDQPKDGEQARTTDMASDPPTDRTLRRTPPVIEGAATEIGAPPRGTAPDAPDTNARVADEPTLEPPTETTAEKPADSPGADETAPQALEKKPRRSLAAPIGIAAGALIVAGVLAWLFSDQLAPSQPPPPKAPAVAARPPAPAAKPEPAKPEPARTESAKTDPAKTESAKSEPTKTESAKSEPAKTEPIKTAAPPSPVVAPQAIAPQPTPTPVRPASPPADLNPPASVAAPSPAADPRIGPALERIDALAAKLDQLAARLDAGRTASEKATADAVRTADALGPKIDGFGQRLAALEQRLDQPKADIRAPEQRDAGAGHAAESLGARAVAAQTAAQNLTAGRPVGPAVAALAALGVEQPRLAPFEPFLAAAPPTLAALGAEWRALKPKILAEPAPQGAWYDALVAKATNLVKIRPVGETTGASAGAVYARVEAALARGDLAGATEAADALSGAARAAAEPWRQSAGRLRAAQEAARALANESISALGRSKT